MDDDEVEVLLRALRTLLAEFGGGAAVLFRDAAPESGAALGARDELSSVLDEYEAVLVDAPRMLASTMKMLNAETMTFAPDLADLRFSSRIAGTTRSPVVDGVTISWDGLGEWMEIAENASKVIAEIRARLDD